MAVESALHKTGDSLGELGAHAAVMGAVSWMFVSVRKGY